MFDPIYLATGVALIVVAAALLRWASPKDDRPSRVPDKWGLSTGVPLLILSLGTAGVLALVKAFL
jgi:hypothetical protein